MLRLRTFGGLWIEGEGGPVAGAAAQRRRLALLALLATAGHGALSRDKILAYLWPEADSERARHLLSQSLYVLRKELDEDIVSTVGDELRLNPAVIASDCQEFESAIAAGQLERAAEIYTGPFLDGYFLSDAPEFERWVDGERRRLAQRAAQVMEAMAGDLTRRGDHVGAAGWWRRLATLDPLSARVAVGFMTALAATGDRSGALQFARVHEALLREELDAAPDPVVTALVERLRAGSGPVTPAEPQPVVPSRVEAPRHAPLADSQPRLPAPPLAIASPPAAYTAAVGELPGELAERYALERVIERGAMATVYLARDLRHDRFVAVKVLMPDAGQPVKARRFLREMKLVARLQHPHILPLLDSGEVNGVLYYVMPLVEGGSLRRRLDRERQVPVEDAVRIARDIAEALGYAHAHGVVHRDIKPENILLSGEHALLADFGIALGPTSDEGMNLTQPGAAIGTPAYMSPEQAIGAAVDARSDIYSLGCVTYEMLAGEPPYAGSDAQAILTQRISDAPPELRSGRRAVPTPVASAVAKAMARVPADRFGNAYEFADALRKPGRSIRAVTALIGSRQRRWAAAALLLTAGSVAAAVVPPMLISAPLDTSVYMVLPFEHHGGTAPELSGDRCALLLYDAFARWQDLRLVNDLRVRDLRARARHPLTLTSALRMARDAGAGILAWGDVYELGDSIIVHAALYDVARRGATIRERRTAVPRNLAEVGARFDELVDSLLVGSSRTKSGAAGAMGTRSFLAWSAYERGQAALDTWDLGAAQREFRTAAKLDPDYAHAQLWVARVLGWMRTDSTDLGRAAAARAVALGDRLTARDRAHAQALLHLAEGNYSLACDEYRTLIGRDSTDFAAWYGLGDCHALDRAVERDRSSRSGWRFRASFHQASMSYQRALRLVPTFNAAFRESALARLRTVLFTEPWQLREGYAGADSARFVSFPSLAGDTLAFIPKPSESLVTGEAERDATSSIAALARNRELLRGLMTTWVQAQPTSALAHELLAQTLESVGEVDSTLPLERSALVAARRARALSTDAAQQLRLAIAETRLRVKAADFPGAARLADSTLAAFPAPTRAEAEQLAGVALLLGRANRSAQLLRRAAAGDTTLTTTARPVFLPSGVAEDAAALLAYASLGVPADSIRVVAARVDRRLAGFVRADARSAARDAAFAFPAWLAFPAVGTAPFGDSAGSAFPLRAAQQQFALGDRAAARTLLLELRRERDALGLRPGDNAIEGTYHEAWLLAALGDTTEALRTLDPVLDALPTLGSMMLTWVPMSAGVTRSMALRADLAAARGDRATARRWAGAVAALWAASDAALAPTVARMRLLARQ